MLINLVRSPNTGRVALTDDDLSVESSTAPAAPRIHHAVSNLGGNVIYDEPIGNSPNNRHDCHIGDGTRESICPRTRRRVRVDSSLSLIRSVTQMSGSTPPPVRSSYSPTPRSLHPRRRLPLVLPFPDDAFDLADQFIVCSATPGLDGRLPPRRDYAIDACHQVSCGSFRRW